MIGKAVLSFVKISPIKLKEVASLIRGKEANKSLVVLQFTNKKGAGILGKVLKSAIANVLQKESSIDEDSLIVKEVRVDEGSRGKRISFAARGGASVIKKRTSHVTIVVEGKPKIKESKKKKTVKDKVKGKPR
ncbi:MAG: 50S ribosomal protein L22 [Candidatus Omnitrophica bacterium]|nr:50S ribosomal protein L22 [Candidatus Omnitrophota bacterium]MBU1048154.1 50S ribosomal protein L22 [Candidatus Omnitrophota bacterium]MBU1767387.1 50S ribosomal protein L22 [Candidatus Omnitrophota bacterium]MBU1889249.1 50S ribosomal protein L22 [Candidatus Omnitrophota bacterium]